MDDIFLYWNDPFNGNTPIMTYRIYRGTNSGSYTFLSTTTDAFFKDSTAVPGQQYFYVVTAVNKVDEGDFSNEVSAKVPSSPATSPGAPQSLNEISLEYRIELSWLPPLSDGGSPITGYRVYRGTSSGEYSLIFITSETTYNDTIVAKELTYYYVVSAINDIGESIFSLEVIATPLFPVSSISTTSTLVTTTTTSNGLNTTSNTTTQAKPGSFPLVIFIFLFICLITVKRRKF